tara:strand:- start:29677 stop:30357 length:681 start_codon:yes stop_codon:yes gene_type:complete
MEKPDKEDGSLLLLEIFSGGEEGAIERQEARGQLQLVQSNSLPTKWEDLYPWDDAYVEAGLESLGFEFGEPYPDDPIFRPVTLPSGWSKRAVAHDMYSVVVDDRGFHRLGMFYKAAIYDRRAGMSPARRINACKSYRDYDKGILHVRVEASLPRKEQQPGMVLVLKEFTFSADDNDFFKQGTDFDEVATWLSTHYPDHRDFFSYWELSLEDFRAKHPDRDLVVVEE